MINDYLVFEYENRKIEAYISKLGNPCIAVYMDSNSYLPEIDRQITPLKWVRLFEDLFNKVQIDLWDKSYSGYDRRYFRLSIDFGDKRPPVYIQGNGGFPDNFEVLLEVFEPYLKGTFDGKNIKRHSKGCAYF